MKIILSRTLVRRLNILINLLNKFLNYMIYLKKTWCLLNRYYIFLAILTISDFIVEVKCQNESEGIIKCTIENKYFRK